MTYIIGKNCIDVLDGACVDVCPVDCIYSSPGDRQLFVNPDECIDCAVCEPVCPVNAIYPEEHVPKEEAEFIKLNYEYNYQESSPGLNTSRMRASVVALNGANPDIGLTILRECRNPDCKRHGHGHTGRGRKQEISWSNEKIT